MMMTTTTATIEPTPASAPAPAPDADVDVDDDSPTKDKTDETEKIDDGGPNANDNGGEGKEKMVQVQDGQIIIMDGANEASTNAVVSVLTADAAAIAIAPEEEKDAAAKTDSLFTKFGLHEYAGKQIENLSHGTRQRLAIASALLHDPKVVVIDEPMVGLDPIHARTVKEELKARSRAGATVLMSTHLLNIAEELADRIGILKEGKLIALGTMEELRHLKERNGMKLEEMFLEMIGEPGE